MMLPQFGGTAEFRLEQIERPAPGPGQRAVFAQAKSTRGDLKRVAQMIDHPQGVMTISRCFLLEQRKEARTQLEQGGTPGKVLVTVGG